MAPFATAKKEDTSCKRSFLPVASYMQIYCLCAMKNAPEIQTRRGGCRRLQRTDSAFFQHRIFFLRLRRRGQRIATTTLQISLPLLLLLLPFSVPPPQTVRAISKQQGKKGPIGSHRCQMQSPRRRRLVPPFLLGRPRSQYVQWRERTNLFFLVSNNVSSQVFLEAKFAATKPVGRPVSHAWWRGTSSNRAIPVQV